MSQTLRNSSKGRKPMRRCSPVLFLIVALLVATPAYTQQSVSWRDPSSHAVRLVNVEKNVRLEVLDWGRTGKPVLLLAGGGNTAHVFDEFGTNSRLVVTCTASRAVGSAHRVSLLPRTLLIAFATMCWPLLTR